MRQMLIFLALLIFIAVCQLSGWNVDNVVSLSAVAWFVVIPAFALVHGVIGALWYYRSSTRNPLQNPWLVNRDADPRKWALRFGTTSVVCGVCGVLAGMYISGWMSAQIDGDRRSVVGIAIGGVGKSVKSSTPCHTRHRFRTEEFGTFTVCTSASRGRRVAIAPGASLEGGSEVAIEIKESAFGATAEAIRPASHDL